MNLNHLFNKHGEQVRFVSTVDNWCSPLFGAVLIPHKARVNQTTISVESKDKSVVLCPDDHNISLLDKSKFIVTCNGKKYKIVESGEVLDSGRIIASWGIIKEININDQCFTLQI